MLDVLGGVPPVDEGVEDLGGGVVPAEELGSGVVPVGWEEPPLDDGVEPPEPRPLQMAVTSLRTATRIVLARV